MIVPEQREQTMRVFRVLVGMCSSIKEKLGIQGVHGVEPDPHATEQQQPTNTQSTQTLNLAVATGEARGRRSE